MTYRNGVVSVHDFVEDVGHGGEDKASGVGVHVAGYLFL